MMAVPPRLPQWLALSLAVSLVVLAGCAQKPQPDPFAAKWDALAEQSQGHSPARPKAPEQRPAATSGVLPPTATSGAKAAESRQLPTRPITLKVRQASLAAIIQALARGAGVSIVTPPGLEGEVNANIVNMPWDQAFLGILKSNGLSYLWEGEIIRVLSVDSLQTNIKLADFEKQLETQRIGRQGLKPSTEVLPIKYANATDLRESIAKLLGLESKDAKAGGGAGGQSQATGLPPASIQADVQSNSLIVRAIPSDLEAVRDIVAKLDTPQAQIKLVAYIIETTRNTAHELGVRWGGMGRWAVRDGNKFWAGPSASNTPGTGGLPDPLTGQPTPSRGSRGLSGQGFVSGVAPSLSTLAKGNGLNLNFLVGKIGSSILETQLMALEEENKVRILSKPSIVTMDNQTAFTSNGMKVPYISRDTAGNAQVNFEEAVLRLEITPHRIDTHNLKLKVLVKNDEVDPVRNVDGNPFIIKKQTETTLITRDGETVVISGLTKNRSAVADAGIPWAKDVAGLGYLFGTKGRGEEMQEVLIFITPEVLPEYVAGQELDPGQENDVAREFRHDTQQPVP